MAEIINAAPDGEDKKIIIEIKDKNYIEKDEKKSFIDVNCQLIVRESDEDGTLISEEEKNGTQIKGRDCIYLNAPNIYFPQDAPLDTKKRELYDILNELFQSGSGDDWQPPEMPEPEAYEIYLLVEVVDPISPKLEIRISRPEDAVAGYGPMSVDWGDGMVDEWTEGTPVPGYPDYYKWSTLSHNYAAVGRYLVKISATEHSCFLQKITPTDNMPYSKVLCAKLGSEIVVNGSRSYDTEAFKNQRRLQYIKMSGKSGLPFETISGCPALKRIDIAVSPQDINGSQFYGCVNLKKFDFASVSQIPDNGLSNAGFTILNLPECTSIGNGGVQSCHMLSKVYAPNCTYVGDNAFLDCYNLQEAVFAEDCVYGANCFQNCYSLFPRPDGSAN